MISLVVSVAGRRVCRAGLPDGILLATLSGVSAPLDPLKSFTLDVDGITAGETLQWHKETLGVGDVVTLEITDSIESDPPSVVRGDPEANALALKAVELQGARRYYALLRRRLVGLEQEWGDQIRTEQDA